MKLLFRYFLFFGQKRKILLRSASTSRLRYCCELNCCHYMSVYCNLRAIIKWTSCCDLQPCSTSASEMTYIVSSGALNSTHSLTPCSTIIQIDTFFLPAWNEIENGDTPFIAYIKIPPVSKCFTRYRRESHDIVLNAVDLQTRFELFWTC